MRFPPSDMDSSLRWNDGLRKSVTPDPGSRPGRARSGVHVEWRKTSGRNPLDTFRPPDMDSSLRWNDHKPGI
jgi:hypothetical protein